MGRNDQQCALSTPAGKLWNNLVCCFQITSNSSYQSLFFLNEPKLTTELCWCLKSLNGGWDIGLFSSFFFLPIFLLELFWVFLTLWTIRADCAFWLHGQTEAHTGLRLLQSFHRLGLWFTRSGEEVDGTDHAYQYAHPPCPLYLLSGSWGLAVHCSKHVTFIFRSLRISLHRDTQES